MKLLACLSLRHGSLRMRLLLDTLAWIALAIAVAGWGLRGLFQDHVHQQLQDQLVRQLNQLSAAVNIDADLRVQVQPMAGDARLSTPLSGVYWQIDVLPAQGPAQLAAARSRSLWDQELALPADTRFPGTTRHGFAVLQLQDAQDHTLLAVSRPLQLPEPQAPLLRLTVAADQALVAKPVQRFTAMLLVALGVLALGLIIAVAVQLQLALRPLDVLRQRLAAVRTGKATQLQGQFPHELQPLVNEFNHVLSANADIVQRARTQAGNLAHLVQEQVATAQRQVDYHLARARAAAAIRATGLRPALQAPLHALLRTMQRLHATRQIAFTLQGDTEGVAFRGEEQDLFEMLGNLLDNAGKWARSEVQLQVQCEGEQLCLLVDDDGPGIPAAQRERIFERGKRLDEQRTGAGLGLDIVRELAQTYGDSIQANTSPRGGLRMRLCLPAVVD